MLPKWLIITLALAAALGKLRPFPPRHPFPPHVHPKPAAPLLPPAAPAGPPSPAPEAQELLPLPAPGDDRYTCPVCGWDPCLEDCRLGLLPHEVEELRQKFEDTDHADGCGGVDD